jgi:hypothetical protein
MERSVFKLASAIVEGDLISTPSGLAWVAWVDADYIGYRDLNGGDYHERVLAAKYEVWLEHPAHAAA